MILCSRRSLPLRTASLEIVFLLDRINEHANILQSSAWKKHSSQFQPKKSPRHNLYFVFFSARKESYWVYFWNKWKNYKHFQNMLILIRQQQTKELRQNEQKMFIRMNTEHKLCLYLGGVHSKQTNNNNLLCLGKQDNSLERSINSFNLHAPVLSLSIFLSWTFPNRSLDLWLPSPFFLFQWCSLFRFLASHNLSASVLLLVAFCLCLCLCSLRIVFSLFFPNFRPPWLETPTNVHFRKWKTMKLGWTNAYRVEYSERLLFTTH